MKPDRTIVYDDTLGHIYKSCVTDCYWRNAGNKKYNCDDCYVKAINILEKKDFIEKEDYKYIKDIKKSVLDKLGD